MIDSSFGLHSLICDICNEEADEQFFKFEDAVNFKKENGWKSKKNGTEWKDVCPDCQNK